MAQKAANTKPKLRSDEVFSSSSRAWNSCEPRYLSFMPDRPCPERQPCGPYLLQRDHEGKGCFARASRAVPPKMGNYPLSFRGSPPIFGPEMPAGTSAP